MSLGTNQSACSTSLPSTAMSSDDCFELGRQSYVNRDYYHTVLWMNEAMTRMLEEPHNQTQSFTRADLLEYLAFSTYKQGKSVCTCCSCLRYILAGCPSVSLSLSRTCGRTCLLLFLDSIGHPLMSP